MTGPQDPSTVSTGELLDSLERLQAAQGARAEDPALQRITRNPLGWCALALRQLRAGKYRPGVLQPLVMPKRTGGQRLLLLPPAEDRIVLGALAQRLQATVGGHLHAASHAYREHHGVSTAIAQVHAGLREGHVWVWRSDIESFFDRIDHRLLQEALLRLDRRLAPLTRWLQPFLCAEVAPRSAARGSPTGLEAAGGACCLVRGLAQGAPTSPVLSNVYLHAFDQQLAEQPGVRHVRYADDLVLLARAEPELRQGIARVHELLARLHLNVRADKSAVYAPGEVFSYLGQSVDPAAGELSRVDQPSATDNRPPNSPAGRGPQPTGEASPADAAMPLMRSLYLLDDHTQLAREGGSLVVHAPGRESLMVPAARVGQVLAFGQTSVTSGAIALCLERAIPVMLLSGRGRHFGCIDPLQPPRLGLLRAQLTALDDEARSCALAQVLIKAKLANSLLLLRRWRRHRSTEALEEGIRRLAEARHRVARMGSRSALRGIEGAAAAVYFKAMGSLLGTEWRFTGRRRQPPPDAVNSMLSYGYTLLYYNTLTLVLGRGLQPHLGLLHAPRAGHHALVSDLMEPFRPLAVDAVVMDLALNGGVRPGHFNWPETEGEACLMSADARRKLINAFEHKMNTRHECPAIDTRIDLRRLLDMQILGLAEHLEGRASTFEAWVSR